jgi:hypothetical protein
MKVAPTLVGIPPRNGAMVGTKRALVTRKGKVDNPVRVLVYGMEKIGKTSFAAQIDRCVFLCKEAGTEQFDVERLSEPTHWRNAPAGEDGRKLDVFSLLEELRTADHDFQALIIDTVDWIEPLLHQYVCVTGPKKVENIVLAYGGYGKGFDVAINEWRSLLAVLERLRTERRMHIVLLGHAHVKGFNNPEGENYDRYELKMHFKSAAVLKEWADAVLFAHQEVFAAQKETVDEKAKNKMFGVSNGARYLYTQRRPAWDAGNRYDLPEKIPLSWHAFFSHAKQKKAPTGDEIIVAIHEKMALISEEHQKEVYELMERAGGDPDKLKQIVQWVESIQQQ